MLNVAFGKLNLVSDGICRVRITKQGSAEQCLAVRGVPLSLLHESDTEHHLNPESGSTQSILGQPQTQALQLNTEARLKLRSGHPSTINSVPRKDMQPRARR